MATRMLTFAGDPDDFKYRLNVEVHNATQRAIRCHIVFFLDGTIFHETANLDDADPTEWSPLMCTFMSHDYTAESSS